MPDLAFRRRSGFDRGRDGDLQLDDANELQDALVEFVIRHVRLVFDLNLLGQQGSRDLEVVLGALLTDATDRVDAMLRPSPRRRSAMKASPSLLREPFGRPAGLPETPG